MMTSKSISAWPWIHRAGSQTKWADGRTGLGSGRGLAGLAGHELAPISIPDSPAAILGLRWGLVAEASVR